MLDIRILYGILCRLWDAYWISQLVSGFPSGGFPIRILLPLYPFSFSAFLLVCILGTPTYMFSLLTDSLAAIYGSLTGTIFSLDIRMLCYWICAGLWDLCWIFGYYTDLLKALGRILRISLPLSRSFYQPLPFPATSTTLKYRGGLGTRTVRFTIYRYCFTEYRYRFTEYRYRFTEYRYRYH